MRTCLRGSAVIDLATTRRDQIERLEHCILEFPQLEIPVRHHFAPGIYAREVTIPAGACVTGKIHKHAHLNIVSQGDITVLTENGLKRICAPFTMLSPPGTKRVGWTHSETVWTTIHPNPTDSRDLAELEARFIAPDRAEFLAFCAAKLEGG
jgi:hypothetical protein